LPPLKLLCKIKSLEKQAILSNKTIFFKKGLIMKNKKQESKAKNKFYGYVRGSNDGVKCL
jgi:hypothetical protein